MTEFMRIAVIPGDGIGKEVTAEAVKVLARGRRGVRAHVRARARCRGAPTTTCRPASRCRRTATTMLRDEFDAIFIGALGDPRVPDNRHARDILLGTRFELDLYVNYRPVQAARRAAVSAEGPRRRRTSTSSCSARTPKALYVSIGGRFKAGHRRRDRDPGRDQHLQGRAPDHPARVRVRDGATG